ARIALGDAGDRELFRRCRVQANFTEYVPLALILMGLAEIQNSSVYVLHIMGFLLVAGRIAHGFGVSQEQEQIGFRVFGMTCTMITLIIGALTNLGLSLSQFL
ncbi:MAG: MAPEG family protein, partial [Methyloligellaceae bacterium]